MLQDEYRAAIGLANTTDSVRGRLYIGGKSMGGRVASLLLDALAAPGPVRGGLCLGYPFHPPGKPQQLRTEHLLTLQTPALFLQGERDPFGRRGEVEGYALSPIPPLLPGAAAKVSAIYAHVRGPLLLDLPGDDRYRVLWDPRQRNTRFDLTALRTHPRV